MDAAYKRESVDKKNKRTELIGNKNECFIKLTDLHYEGNQQQCINQDMAAIFLSVQIKMTTASNVVVLSSSLPSHAP